MPHGRKNVKKALSVRSGLLCKKPAEAELQRALKRMGNGT